MNRNAHNINCQSTINVFIKYISFLVLFAIISFYFLAINNKAFAADINIELPEGVLQSELVDAPLTDAERADFLKYLEENNVFQNPETGNGVSCFDYYKFQSVQVSVGTDKDIYTPSETVQFNGELQNENNYPVVDGYVFVRISKEADDYITDGNDIVDEFFGVEKVAIDANSKKKTEFKWNVPKDITGGQYRADYFFSVGKKFTLGGLPFSNEVIIGSANFAINSTQKGISFDRKSTKVNGKKYRHIGDWPTVEKNVQTIITQPIKNTSDKDMVVKVTYDLYWWDGLNEKDKITTKSESITIAPKSSKILSYSIPQVEEPVYYLRITAVSGSQKSIVNIRILSDIPRPRLNYPAITKFPLRRGDNAVLFSCFHNTSNVSADGKVLVTLYDKSDKKIDSVEYSGVISGAMMAIKKNLKIDNDYDFVKIVAQVFDSNNSEVDHYESVYNCENIDKNKCKQSYVLAILIVIVLALIVIISTRFFITKSKNEKNENKHF